MGDGYHGCHAVAALHKRLQGLQTVALHDVKQWHPAGLGKENLVHVETPLNPTGEVANIRYFAKLAHEHGALLSVDATLGPPGLQDPFRQGADIVMHSGTKYIGGHSDMLCGVLVVKDLKLYRGLLHDRLLLGSVMGSLEGWLGLRSIRTLNLRIQAQSRNADVLVRWLHSLLQDDETVSLEHRKKVRGVLLQVKHASLQDDRGSWLEEQMPNGFGAVFAIWMKTEQLARALPSKLKYFNHATSLGGVESLIEWRRMSDAGVDPRLLRLSIGIEAWQDLREDLLHGFIALFDEHSSSQ